MRRVEYRSTQRPEKHKCPQCTNGRSPYGGNCELCKGTMLVPYSFGSRP